jgi:hypothetical protein
MQLPTSLFLLAATAGLTSAHGSHEQIPVAADADWATRHMAEEHHIAAFDSAAFFNLHDYDSSNEWTREDLLKTYGLKDPSTDHISREQKEAGINKVLEIYDKDKSGTISFAEYTIGTDTAGLRMPDLGFGPGHHGDDEYEYEIHHFEKYHSTGSGEHGEVREEDLNHPEDIEHFKKHEEMEFSEEEQRLMDLMKIVDKNIPQKFRRPSV